MRLKRLKESLSYDPDTGIFRWKVRAADNTKVGTIAGNTSVFGYRRIRLDGKLYFSHRLAWFYHYGRWPKFEIDHINSKKSDNRIANLRDVTRKMNKQNLRKPQGRSKTGFLGVYPSLSKFTSKISSDGRVFHLGTFDTSAAAHRAYVKAKRKLHPAGML